MPFLILLAFAHFALAIVYAQLTPYRTAGILVRQKNVETGEPQRAIDIGAPDERQHANYVAHLLSRKGFPVLVWQIPNPADPERPLPNPELGETYQSHQPPLYYLLAAGWSKLAGADPQGPSGIRIRWLNALIGAGTVLGVFFLGYWGSRRIAAPLAAAAFAALLPMHLALSGAISNDPLLYLLCTWFLAVGALVLQFGWQWKYVLALGILLGLASLTKTTAIALFAVIAYLVFATRKQEQTVTRAGAAFMLGVLIVAPWWLRNNSLYGDPFALGAFREAFVGSPPAAAFIQSFGPFRYFTEWVGVWTLQSFFGVFGYMDILIRPDWIYWLLSFLVLVAALGFVYRLTRRLPSDEMTIHGMNAVFLLVVLLLFVQFNLQYFQGQARYLLPAVGPISLGIAFGLITLARERGREVAVGTALALLAVNVYVLSFLPAEFRLRSGGNGVPTGQQVE